MILIRKPPDPNHGEARFGNWSLCPCVFCKWEDISIFDLSDLMMGIQQALQTHPARTAGQGNKRNEVLKRLVYLRDLMDHGHGVNI